MSVPTWIRSELIDSEKNERLPERVPGIWSALLLAGDALAAAIAALLVGLPVHAVPAVCLLICAAGWFVGGDHVSYAARSRDQCYHVIAMIVAAAVPVFAVLVWVGGFSWLQGIVILPFAFALLCPLHIGLHVMRYADAVPDGGLDAVSPRAKRRIASPAFRAFKRSVDATLAGIAVVLLSPVMLAIAFMILRDSDGPVFFAQERVGRDRHRFVIYKFRTMRQDAGDEWVKPGDERVTRMGAFLRRTSLDELPQLINVLKGDMSLVGPRPEMPEYAHEFRSKIPHYDDRSLVDPGITGWAQIQLDRNLTPSEMARVIPYDLFYVEHTSFGLDLYVVIKTLVEIATHRGL
jgi:lipopolysaccharide/colanic/teichoic acid biosynthesis glycosyltransferase